MQSAKKKVIYSLRVYLELQKAGFYPIATMPNPNNQKLMCWVYDKTPQLVQQIDKILGG